MKPSTWSNLRKGALASLAAGIVLTGCLPPKRPTGPRLVFSPGPIEVTADHARAEELHPVLTLKNVGDARAMTILGVEFWPDDLGPTGWSIDQENCTGRALGPNESCSVNLTFVALFARSFEDVGQVHFLWTTAGVSTAARLIGHAKSAIAVDPYATQIDSQSEKTFTITNRGTATIDGLATLLFPSGTGFVVVDDQCSGSAVPPDATCKITLGYPPASPSNEDVLLLVGAMQGADQLVAIAPVHGGPIYSGAPP
jgi:hypothetical protein